MDGIKSLLGSKKAILGLVLVICATVLFGLGRMSIGDWQDYTRWIALSYFGAETINGVAATIKGADAEKPAPPPAPAPAPAPDPGGE